MELEEEENYLPEDEFKRFVRDVENNDSLYLGTTLREVYNRNLHDLFEIRLATRVEHYDSQIESICNHHYGKLSNAIYELREVTDLVKKLQTQVAEIDGQANDTCEEVVFKMAEKQRLQIQRKNIYRSIEQLEGLLPLFQKFIKLNQQMKKDELYRALRSIQEINSEHLDKLPTRMKLKKYLRDNLLAKQKKIYADSVILLTNWLDSARANSLIVGKLAMEEDGDELRALDFKPIFKCLQISQMRGTSIDFFHNFIVQRNKQFTQIVSSPISSSQKLEEYLYSIVGFLYIEENIQSSDKHLSETVAQMWLKFEDRIVTNIKSYQSRINDPIEYEKVKNLIKNLRVALKKINLDVTSLSTVLTMLREQYLEVLLARYAEFFDLILKQDNFAPLIVSCKEEELEIFTLFPFNSEEVNGNFGALESPGHAPNNYPKKLPFSRMVLRIFGRMKEFIDEYFLYFSGSDLNRIQRDDQARRAVISLIKRALRQTIKTKLDQNNVGLNELMQLSINVGCLASACPELCVYIQKKTFTEQPPEVKSLSNVGSQSFKDIRAEIQMQIPPRIQAKVDQILELGFDEFDFTSEEDPTGQSDHIRSAIDFVRNNLKMLSKLSRQVQETTLFVVCQHIGTVLMEWLTEDEEPSMISINGLRQMMIDVNYLEYFAGDAIPEFSEATETFVPIHQLLDLTIKSDWPQYLSSYGSLESPYLRIQPNQARQAYEKIIRYQEIGQSSSGGGMLSAMKQKSRDADRKRLWGEMIKKLKQLETGAIGS
ncbi:unnamed protein product [Oikopleura dioica]|uniref:Uncharacterized protein n=1 Tax=Oikopleura dioica TaxID=34765 RepID=E4YI72_OIKDI|nr:unnamed protein product [Oikopleura dioica]